MYGNIRLDKLIKLFLSLDLFCSYSFLILFILGDSDSGSQGYCSDVFQFSPDSNGSNKGPYIEIIDQPGDFRYRYEKEKYHGHILSINSPTSTKKKDSCKFPKIKIHNCHNDVIVRCWLISSKLDDKPTAHFHKLARKLPKGQMKLEPHDFHATDRNNYEITFDYLYIIHAVSGDPNDVQIYEEKKAWLESGSFKRPKLGLSVSDPQELKQMDRNQSILYFEVFDAFSEEKLCEAVSRKIKNLHNVETAALKIVNYSRTFGTCRGGDEVFMFVEKISKDVEVQFFELKKGSRERSWQARADYGPQHVHHQYGIVFRTPRFHDLQLKEDVQVFIELYRKTDQATSNPVKFTYKPEESCRTFDLHKKRPHSPERSLKGSNILLSEYGMKKSREEIMSPDSTSCVNTAIPNRMNDQIELSEILNSEWISCIEDPTWLIDDMTDLQNLENDHLPTTVREFSGLTNLLSNGELSSDGISSLKYNNLLKKGVPQAQAQGPKLLNDDISSQEVSSSVELRDSSSVELTDSSSVELTDDHSMMLSHPDLREIIVTIKTNKNLSNFKKYLEALNAETVNEVDFEGDSLLLIAARHSKEATSTLLSNKHINKNVTNLDGDNALLCAARHGKSDVVEILLKNKFNPDEHNYKTGETALHLAVFAENLTLINLLLRYGANPLVENFGSLSAYDYSCYIQNKETKQLICNKAQDMFLKQRAQISKRCITERDLIENLQALKVSST